MKKTILVLFVLLSSSTYIYAQACGCRDMGTVQQLGETSVGTFEGLDADTANKISEIIQEIKRGHEEIEEANKKTLKNLESLNREYAILEKDILFNQIIIKKLKGVAIDSVGSK